MMSDVLQEKGGEGYCEFCLTDLYTDFLAYPKKQKCRHLPCSQEKWDGGRFNSKKCMI